jgi:hypothetical protein
MSVIHLLRSGITRGVPAGRRSVAYGAYAMLNTQHVGTDDV